MMNLLKLHLNQYILHIKERIDKLMTEATPKNFSSYLDDTTKYKIIKQSTMNGFTVTSYVHNRTPEETEKVKQDIVRKVLKILAEYD